MKNARHLFIEFADTLENEMSQYPPGTPVPSLNKIVERFDTSRGTAKRTMLELQQRGLIYSMAGHGSFMAPSAKKYTILVAFGIEGELRQHNMFNQEFLVRALIYCNRHYPDYTVSAVDFAELRRDINTIEIRNPGLKGIIILRYIHEYMDLVGILEKNGIPVCFYGSSTHMSDLRELDYLVYNEGKIIETAVNTLLERGCLRVGYQSDSFIVYRERERLLLSILKKRGLKCIRLEAGYSSLDNEKLLCFSTKEEKQTVRLFFSKIDGMVCFDDVSAAAFAHTAIELGFKIPEDIAIVGINNHLIDFFRPGITSIALNTGSDAERCMDLMLKRIISGKRFQEEAPISLVRRETA